MDKLTAIKIKYDDGTYSDEIPVGVLSENVEWDSTHTLVDVLGSIDVDVTGTIQDQISQLFNEKVDATQLNNYVASQLSIDATNWLNNNVDPVGSAVIVDSSLTIQGAAADAKIVGDNIGNLKNAFELIINKNNLFENAPSVDNAYYAGLESTDVNKKYYKISLIAGTSYSFRGVRFISTESELLEDIKSSQWLHTFTPESSGTYYITIDKLDPIHFFTTTVNYNNGWYGTNEQPYLANHIILQDLGESTMATMSQKAISDNIGNLKSAFDNRTDTVNNLINKNNLFVGAVGWVFGYYYDTEAKSSSDYDYCKVGLVGGTSYTMRGVRFISDGTSVVLNYESPDYITSFTPETSGDYFVTVLKKTAPVRFLVTTANYNAGDYGTLEQPYLADHLVLQTTGNNKMAGMSQAAVSGELNHIVTHLNLANPAEFTENHYMGPDGTAGNSSSYFYTGYINVDGIDKISFTNARFLTAYDENKNAIVDSGIDSPSISAKSYDVPNNIKYVIITGETANKSVFMVNRGELLYAFTPYSVEEMNPDFLSTQKTNVAFSGCGADAYAKEISSLNSGADAYLDDAPQNLKNGVVLTAYCEFSSFNSFVVGKGYNSYRGDWFDIGMTSVKHYHYENSAQVVDEQNHGLTISEYINVVIDIKPNGKANVNINSTGGTTTLEFSLTHEQNGVPFLFGRQQISNIQFRSVSTMAKCPLWIIGDSYLGYDSDRVMGQLDAIGYTQHILVDGLAGQGSVNAWREFTNLILNGNRPKYLIWYIGMNDTDAVYTEYLAKVAYLCEHYGITLIINDVPTVPNVDNEAKHTLVTAYKAQGYRTVNSYEAVGANSSGAWRTGYLSGDNVHPTVLGAKALAMALLLSVPEIAQYD